MHIFPAYKSLPAAFALCLALSGKAQPYRNLALEGGGIRGIAYAGAIKVLEDRHVLDSIRNIAGTSVGAVAGLMLSTGYTADEIKALMYDLKIQTFNDGSWFFIGGQQRMRTRFGWYRGNALERWLGALAAGKTGNEHLTFEELHRLALSDARYKDLYVTATNLSRQCLTVFSWKTYPHMEIRTAVRTSISIPLYFTAMLLDSAGHKAVKGSSGSYEVFSDGGIVANYPLALFDSGSVNHGTLGLKLERPEQIDYFRQSDGIAHYSIRSLRGYVGAFYNLVIETLNRHMAYADESVRTIYISTQNITPKVRHVTRQQKDILYQSGLKAAEQFFK